MFEGTIIMFIIFDYIIIMFEGTMLTLLYATILSLSLEELLFPHPRSNDMKNCILEMNSAWKCTSLVRPNVGMILTKWQREWSEQLDTDDRERDFRSTSWCLCLGYKNSALQAHLRAIDISSAENQKGVNAVQQCSIENQNGNIAIDLAQQ